uniref:Cytochrome b5 heme-binding domain-containing protein n=1 Tax=Elaeophora elaphi TaxID=1147741 RepID=A0A0R3RQG1_9BILA
MGLRVEEQGAVGHCLRGSESVRHCFVGARSTGFCHWSASCCRIGGLVFFRRTMFCCFPCEYWSEVSLTRRSKVALTHGRSLMDWIKFTSSRSAKANIKRYVDHAELTKHASVGDCWILLGERVYDVTDYLAFHPGGVEELMRAAGTDGTDLFNKIHAWVNYDTMLKTCFVGTFNGNRYKLSKSKTENFIEETNSNIVNFETARVRVEVSFDGQVRVSSPKWDQLRNENVSLEFMENILRLLLHFSTGKTEVLQWSNLSTSIFDESFGVSINGKVISLSCKEIDKNITSQWTSGSYHYKPGSLIERPYTPVIVSEDGQFISFMIKFYENGIFTSKLRDKKCGDSIKISDPLGCFNVQPDFAGMVLMLAAGTGLSSMVRFTAERLKSKKRHDLLATMIIFNKKEIDVVPDDYFTKYEIPLNHPLLKIKHFLSEADQKWNGEKGIISKQILSKYIDGNAEKTTYRILISGPNPFVDLAAKLLEELEMPLGHIHIFQS